MNRGWEVFDVEYEGVPRACGDEPWTIPSITANLKRSPRMRG